MADLSVNLNGLTLNNPVMSASGTFGYGSEFDDFFDVSLLGGIILKGITAEPREGNPYPRMAETASGMLNSVGLQNRGVRHFVSEIYDVVSRYDTRVVVNVNGSNIEEYVTVASQVATLDKIPAIELNISCPNVKMGGMAFGTDRKSAREVIRAVRNVWPRHMMVKLSPNVTSITEFARIAEEEGADSVSLINTLLGMAIDSRTRRPKLATVTGGLSGPAVKPVALRMVWQVSKAVKIPVVGLGGIMNAEDAVEFILAGASAVQVGTASFINPAACINIIEGLKNYCLENGIERIESLTGSLMV
ncbi:MAG: dihydroorotate dehydrogenase [Bacteroidales bacterium]|jgi:dihydroorotate dehydrogenase (NAD+) catalytic subunit|nr:dihydroorotate dehydrogenase [Bacteroidales bacterium]